MATSLQAAGILGSGAFLPPRRVTSAELESREYVSGNGERYSLPAGDIEARTGIRERRFSDQPTSVMAALAGRAALADSGLTPADLDLVLLATSTPDHPVPKSAPRVAHLLGAGGVAAWDVGKDCTGFVEALEVACQMVRAGARQRVLVIGADRLSAIVDPANKATAVVFGDGAGAAVVGPVGQGGWLGSVAGSDGSNLEKLYVPSGGAALRMDGKAVFDFATNALPAALRLLTHAHGLSLDSIDLVIPHQSNLRILERAAASLGWDLSRFVINLDRLGNTAAASVAIALDQARHDGRVKPGSLVALVAYGAGLSWMASLWRA